MIPDNRVRSSGSSREDLSNRSSNSISRANKKEPTPLEADSLLEGRKFDWKF